MLPESFQFFLLALYARFPLFVSLLELFEFAFPLLRRDVGCCLHGLIVVHVGVNGVVAVVVSLVVWLVVNPPFVLCFCEKSDTVISVAVVSYVYL